MTDTHCHLTDPRLGDHLEDVLVRAAAAGVSRVVTIGTDLADSRDAVMVAVNRPNVRAVVGVHPNYVDGVDFNDLPQLRGIQDSGAVVGIGEIGLDYSRQPVDRARQIEFLKYQLEVAKDFSRPVVIHCREAVDDCLPIVRQFPGVEMVFHCFTGTVDEARRILDAGYLLGFTGVVTFKKSDALRDVVRLTPVDRMLVETDGPYLSPEPVRKFKTCEPAFVVHTARFVADLKGLAVDEFERITDRTAAGFYGWES